MAAGLLFGILFVFWLVNLIDIHAKGGSFGFRLMILPTSIILWPLILILFIARTSTVPKAPPTQPALKAEQPVIKKQAKRNNTKSAKTQLAKSPKKKLAKKAKGAQSKRSGSAKKSAK